MKKLLKFILDCLFPLCCLNCQREDFWLCQSCQYNLPVEPSYESFEKILVFSAISYEQGLIKKIIKTCKFSGIPELASILGDLLIKGALSFPEIKDLINNSTNLLIIPIPLSPRRKRERGFNQSLIIAKKFSEYFNLPINDQLQKQERPPQAELSGKKRLKNIANAFSWSGERLDGFHVLLIDDVVTTGATIAEANKVIKRAGAKRVTGLVVAR